MYSRCVSVHLFYETYGRNQEDIISAASQSLTCSSANAFACINNKVVLSFQHRNLNPYYNYLIKDVCLSLLTFHDIIFMSTLPCFTLINWIGTHVCTCSDSVVCKGTDSVFPCRSAFTERGEIKYCFIVHCHSLRDHLLFSFPLSSRIKPPALLWHNVKVCWH